jgi:hypothetical protein
MVRRGSTVRLRQRALRRPHAAWIPVYDEHSPPSRPFGPRDDADNVVAH